MYRNLNYYLLVPKYLAVACYILTTQFEKPDWCIRINVAFKTNNTKAQKDYPGWNSTTCNDAAGSYTQFEPLSAKLDELSSTILELLSLFFLMLTQWIRR